MSRTTKVSVSLPTALLARADEILGRPGEGRSALFARILNQAVGTAEEAEIDAEYERAYKDHPIGDDERRVLDAFTKASARSLQRSPGQRG
jgi:metal-responsive CopG/Arc/MetJ family transcriptional regulator